MPQSSRAGREVQVSQTQSFFKCALERLHQGPRGFAKPVASWASLELESAFDTLFKRF